jgi:hypothetical protein
MNEETRKPELDLGLVEDLKGCYKDLSLADMKDFMLDQTAIGYTEAVEALVSLGCPRPSEEEMQKYLSLGKTWEERNERIREEEKRKREEENRLNTEKYWILRRNSPRLDAELNEAHRNREEASKNYVRIKNQLWEKHKEYKRGTDPYWCSGAHDAQFQDMLDRNPDSRYYNDIHRSRWQKSDDLEMLFINWAHKLSVEEARNTNLDEQSKELKGGRKNE